MPDHRCIYCRTPQTAFSREHVLQYALGGGLEILDAVCGTCNRDVLGPLDRALTDYSIVSLGRVGVGPGGYASKEAESKFASLIDTPGSGALEVKMKQGFKPTIKPQLIIDLTTGKETFAASPETVGDRQSALEDFRVGLERFGCDRLKIITENLGKTVAPRVIRENDRYFFVRAMDEAEGRRLVDFLQKWVTSGTTPTPDHVGEARHEQPWVVSQIRMDWPAVQCAVAKVGLNYVSSVYGREIALDSRFDDIREFIFSGRESSDGRGLVGLQSAPVRGKAQPNSHSVLLVPSKDAVWAAMCFYDHFEFLVQLSDKSFLNLDPALTYFEHTTRTVRRIPTDELSAYLDIATGT